MRKYILRVKNAYKSLRTKVMWITTIILSAMTVMPEKIQTIMIHVVSKSFVDMYWDLVTAIVAVTGLVLHTHGTARYESDIPVEERV